MSTTERLSVGVNTTMGGQDDKKGYFPLKKFQLELSPIGSSFYVSKFIDPFPYVYG